MTARSVVLVEGESDRVALVALAGRMGLDVSDVSIVAMGGATSIVHFADRYGPDVRVLGLCDEREARAFRRAGVATFFVCRADLEDELIRALGVDGVVHVIEAAGDGPSWRRMRAQPAQRDRPVDQQLRRFMGTRSGRKERYAGLLVDALDPDRAPAPLVDVLHAATAS